MGVFSEMSIEQERGDSPTPANIVPSAPAEPETPAWDEPAVTAPPAFEEEPHQKTEPETDPAALIQVNDAPDGEQTVPQTSDAADGHENTADSKDEDDAKRKAHEAAEAQRKADWETSLDKGIQGKEVKKVLPTLHKTPPNGTIGGVFVCGGKSLNPGPRGYAAPIATRRYLQAWQTKPRPTPRRKRRAALPLPRRSRRNRR